MTTTKMQIKYSQILTASNNSAPEQDIIYNSLNYENRLHMIALKQSAIIVQRTSDKEISIFVSCIQSVIAI